MTRYQNATNTRRVSRSVAGRFRGGKLAPVMAEVLRESESCILSQSVTYELDPIAGRMITPITGGAVAVYVPVQAIDALKNPSEDYAGNTEIVRDKLLSGTPLFGLEQENEISKRLGVVPRSIAGQKMVSEVGRLAHNCAVNFLRRRKYVNAVQLLAANMGVTPALIGQTVLERLNGVLDPEDRVEGAVNLSMGNMNLPVHGLGYHTTPSYTATPVVGAAGETMTPKYTPAGGNLMAKEDPDNPGYLGVFAKFQGGAAGSVSLTDFYNAELMDQLTREMRQIVDENPEYGEEMVIAWAHGLSIDNGRQPFVLYEKEITLGADLRRATDGGNLDVSQTDMGAMVDYTIPVPPTELGGVVITFAYVKPDETLASQPHPFLSEPWGAINYVSDEMARDPVPVTIRELDADCATGDETTVALYVGHNGLKRSYINYGFNRHIDLTTVESKTSLWQLEVPMSVTPESVIYPETLEHYPFQDQLAEVCTYTVTSVATVRTPLVFGPTPVEELAAIETGDVFDES